MGPLLAVVVKEGIGMRLKRVVRCLTSILLVLPATLGLSGCYNAGADTYKSVAPGSNLDIQGLELRSISIVSAAEDKPGRLLGTVFNTTGEDIGLVIRDRNDTVQVTVPAKGNIGFDTTELILQSTEDPPGARTNLTVEAKADSKVTDIPVLDGTLSQYAPYVPE